MAHFPGRLFNRAAAFIFGSFSEMANIKSESSWSGGEQESGVMFPLLLPSRKVSCLLFPSSQTLHTLAWDLPLGLQDSRQNGFGKKNLNTLPFLDNGILGTR